MNKFLTNLIINLANVDNNPIFALSIVPYLIFLFFLYKIKLINKTIKIGFSLTILFVSITIIFSILSQYIYGKSLVEVDIFHGSAELFLTISDFIILLGFIKILNLLEVKNS
ncbi:MAG: hypothetical protein CMK49_02940 [Prochlorococcus sp. SP3034]|nr:hypothetical protein [Prochlorococcus sp. SP3034]|tara:strand:- start:3046 stop:3381 length:336 start_codon:yes stop_codon:yes gene_type:complete